MDSTKRHSVSSSISSDSLDSDDKEKHCIFESNYERNMYDSPVWSFTGASTTQSPFHYTMEGDYDPNRIPASVFAKSNPNEQWSVASNDSLFSIRLGNGSFITRDISFAYNNNNKSGEPSMPPLPPLQELSPENNSRHSVSSDSSDGGVILSLGKNEHKNDEKSRKVETTVVDKTNKMDHHGKEVNVNVPSSASYQSIESGCSFQFPILTNDGGRASSATVKLEEKESEMHEKIENQQQQPRPEKPLAPPPPPLPEDKKAPKNGRKKRYCCFCFPCF